MRARPWTDLEIDALHRLRSLGNIAAIAKELGRPYNSVYGKMVYLGLHGPESQTPQSPRRYATQKSKIADVSCSLTDSPFLDALCKQRRYAQDFEFYCDKCDKGFHIEPLKRRGKKLCAACYVDGNRFIRAATQMHCVEPARP